METPKYKRILLKLSGEALAGKAGTGLDFTILDAMAEAIGDCVKAGAQMAVVIGAGNFWRGASALGGKIERTRSDYMGMLGTTMNCLALCDVLEQHGIPAVVQNALDIHKVSEPFNRVEAIKHLEQGKVVIFAGGSGCPFFTTDTAAALRAAEIGADALFCAKNIDGVYDDDPRKNPNAKRLDRITHKEVLVKGLAALDNTATAMAMNTDMPVHVFKLEGDNIKRVFLGETLGTYVANEI